jgi:peroxiredoxin
MRARSPSLLSLLLVLCSLALAPLLAADPPEKNPPAKAPPVKVGGAVKDLSFKDIRFVLRTLDDFPAKKAFVLVFTDTQCPVAGRYAPHLSALAREYEGRGVQFLGVNSSPSDTLVEVAADALEKRTAFPVHKDFDQSAMRALGVRSTPEAAVLDAGRVLRYRGRIDDRFRVAGESPAAGREYLREAIEAVLAGRTPAVEDTPVEGCRITLQREPQRPGVNFAEHIAPLLQKHCQTCHRPGQPAPFPLLEYGDAARRAAMLREVVEERRMPPSFNDPRFGSFSNRRALTDEEIETVAAWAAAGAPRGDPAKAPPPIAWPESPWLIGEPDLVLEMPDEFRVPATGYVKYQYSVPDYVFPHDTWVSAIQILPGNRRVLHHANLYILQPPPHDRTPAFLTGQVPGGEATVYGRNEGILIPEGSRLRLQLHYVTTGKEESDRTRIGIVYAKERIERGTRCLILINRSFRIAPFDPAFEVRARGRFPEDAAGVGLYVHMHVRGKDMTFHAAFPDGRRETLLSVPNYNFSWQMSYRWPEGAARFPAGTEIETVSHYDNSTSNPFNPDPAQTVIEGQQTFEEMNYGFLFYVNAGEKLGIEVDPRSGRPLGRSAGASSPLRSF